MRILLDIGNTRLKWGVEDQNRVQFRGVIDYRQQNFADVVFSAWRNLNSPNALVISSVGSTEIVEQLMSLAKSLWTGVDIMLASSAAQGGGVSNAYRQPEKLGVDRWVSLLALRHYYPGRSCVIDCGTAITLDFLDETGRHLGGLISPGLSLMKQSLKQGTSDLPFSDTEQALGLADHTEAAIYSGTLYSAIGLIEHVLAEQDYPEQVVITGGDGPLIARNLAVRTVVEPDFVLKGLGLYCLQKH